MYQISEIKIKTVPSPKKIKEIQLSLPLFAETLLFNSLIIAPIRKKMKPKSKSQNQV